MTLDKIDYLDKSTNDNPNRIVFLFFRQKKVYDKVHDDASPKIVKDRKSVRITIRTDRSKGFE